MSNDNRNMILAVVLSALVLFGWGFLTQSVVPTANPPATKTENGKQAPAAQPQPQAAPRAGRAARQSQPRHGGPRQPRPGRAHRDPHAAPLRLAQPDRRADRRSRPRRDRPQARPSRRHRPQRPPDPPVLAGRHARALIMPASAGAARPACPRPTRLEGDGCAREAQRPAPAPALAPSPAPAAGPAAAPAPPPPSNAIRAVALTPAQPVTLTHDNGRGQVYRIVLRVDDGYLFTAEQSVINRGAPVVSVGTKGAGQPGRHLAPTTTPGPAMSARSGVFNGSANYDTDYQRRRRTPPDRATDAGRLARLHRPILAGRGRSRAGHGRRGQFPPLGPATSTRPISRCRRRELGTNRALRTTAHLFAGAKEIGLLDRYSDSLGTDLGRAIDWGWFDFIMKPIFALADVAVLPASAISAWRSSSW